MNSLNIIYSEAFVVLSFHRCSPFPYTQYEAGTSKIMLPDA